MATGRRSLGSIIASAVARIGAWPSAGTYAMFGNDSLDQTAAGNYALLQGPSGDTLLNAATGQGIGARINNVDKVMVCNANGNFGVGTTTDFANGAGVIGLHDTGSVPNTNPTAGIVAYSQSGVLKYRQPAGTIVTLDGSAAAPSLARTFALMGA